MGSTCSCQRLVDEISSRQTRNRNTEPRLLDSNLSSSGVGETPGNSFGNPAKGDEQLSDMIMQTAVHPSLIPVVMNPEDLGNIALPQDAGGPLRPVSPHQPEGSSEEHATPPVGTPVIGTPLTNTPLANPFADTQPFIIPQPQTQDNVVAGGYATTEDPLQQHSEPAVRFSEPYEPSDRARGSITQAPEPLPEPLPKAQSEPHQYKPFVIQDETDPYATGSDDESSDEALRERTSSLYRPKSAFKWDDAEIQKQEDDMRAQMEFLMRQETNEMQQQYQNQFGRRLTHESSETDEFASASDREVTPQVDRDEMAAMAEQLALLQSQNNSFQG